MNEYEQNGGLGPEGSYFEAKARAEEQARRKESNAMFPVWISILYVVLGALFNLWHPGWLLFFTIPLHYIEPDITSKVISKDLFRDTLGSFLTNTSNNAD
jgi:multidrug efflux pump subunit AcrB